MHTPSSFPIPSRCRSLLLLLTLATVPCFGQLYRKGDVIEPFTLTQRGSNEPIRLEDYAGTILFVEWFAWWCSFCQAAAPQVEEGIVRYYSDRNGNPDGIPVVHLAVNLQAGQEPQTQNFVNRAGFHLVAEDFNRALAGRFQSGGQPIFAIINGVTNSPSHKPWELLLHQNGYGTTQSPIQSFRSAIDAVRSAPTLTPPRIDAQPRSARVSAGAAARFDITVSGSSPFSFQWAKNGTDLPGATTPTLELSNTQKSDAGLYTVRVSNTAGNTISEPATLAVVGPATTPPTLTWTRTTGDNRSLLLQIHSTPDSLLRLQQSTDLVTWIDVSTLASPESVHSLELPFADESSASFWRVVSP